MKRLLIIQILFISFNNFGYSSEYYEVSGYKCEYESGGVWYNCTISYSNGSWVKGNFPENENVTVYPNLRAYFAENNYYIFGTGYFINNSYIDFRGKVEVEYLGKKYDLNINSAKDIKVNELTYLTPKKDTSSSIPQAKIECEELGFQKGTDSFADCVRQLSGF
tara:strand:- start:524 stop:1015 length:492 start_codon:yes stop_codon:yes gene_type:complete